MKIRRVMKDRTDEPYALFSRRISPRMKCIVRSIAPERDRERDGQSYAYTLVRMHDSELHMLSRQTAVSTVHAALRCSTATHGSARYPIQPFIGPS